MQKHLFLSGLPGCGKTTMINNALGDKLALAGGFITVRMRDDDGNVIGYDMFPSAAAGGVSGFTGERFLDYSVTPRVHNNEVFRTTGVRLLKEAQYYPFALVDEFGGFEIIIPEFREALLDFLSGDQPCIGVLKAMPNAETLKRKLSLGDKYVDLLSSLTKALRADPDTLVLDTTGRYDENAHRIVQAWVDEYA